MTEPRMERLFHISSEASEHIRRLYADSRQELVVFIGARVQDSAMAAERYKSADIAVVNGTAKFARLPPNLRAQLSIWTDKKEGVASDDLHSVDGFLFAVPLELLKIIGERELVLRNGELCFEPNTVDIALPRNSPLGPS